MTRLKKLTEFKTLGDLLDAAMKDLELTMTSKPKIRIDMNLWLDRPEDAILDPADPFDTNECQVCLAGNALLRRHTKEVLKYFEEDGGALTFWVVPHADQEPFPLVSVTSRIRPTSILSSGHRRADGYFYFTARYHVPGTYVPANADINLDEEQLAYYLLQFIEP